MKSFRIGSVVAGALSGALVFALLSLAHAQQTLTVHDFRVNPKLYVGHEVTITGLAGPVRHDEKTVNGAKVAYVAFGIQEQDPKGRKTGYNIWIHLPVTAFGSQEPTENSTVSVTGVPKWPWTVATIEQ